MLLDGHDVLLTHFSSDIEHVIRAVIIINVTGDMMVVRYEIGRESTKQFILKVKDYRVCFLDILEQLIISFL